MFLDNPNTFLGNPLDRAGNRRRDPAWVARQAYHRSALALISDGGNLLFDRGKIRSHIRWVPMDDVPPFDPAGETVLLGLDDGAPRFAVPAEGLDLSALGGDFLPLRKAAPYLLREEAAIAGQAVWLLDWHRRHRHCARDGGETVVAEGGFRRVNPITGAEHFPRTDPVSIVVPHHADEICLGRGPNFPEGVFSAFAGFVEPCETLEECASRELFEEAGLEARSVTYVFSQPWPFPSSLMVGFLAEVTGRDLRLDPQEIAEARWFSRAQIAELIEKPGTDELRVPPPMAIAHQLLKIWLAR